MKVFKNGLLTGLILQLAIGPVLFFIMNLTLQKNIFYGFAGVMAVTLVDYIYITLSIIAIVYLLDRKNIKNLFGIISSIVLIVFGYIVILNSTNGIAITNLSTMNIFSSFIFIFLLTISNPITIVSFMVLFTTKAIEYNYTKRQLVVFGFATGLITLLFMGTLVVLFSTINLNISNFIVTIIGFIVGMLFFFSKSFFIILNVIAGILFVVYGGIGLIKNYKLNIKKN